ncbi:MAG: DUF1801 domain-containing protein [Gammaproteobacteria bacterium]
MEITENPDVAIKFNHYPDDVREKLLFLRSLIIQTASEIYDLNKIEETLKWGEPSYLTKNGSTIRIDWKENSPNQYAMYFNCKTKLVDTFKERYGETFKFEGNRAIIFDVTENIPVDELKRCIELALTCHSIKHLPMLGL